MDTYKSFYDTGIACLYYDSNLNKNSTKFFPKRFCSNVEFVHDNNTTNRGNDTMSDGQMTQFVNQVRVHLRLNSTHDEAITKAISAAIIWFSSGSLCTNNSTLMDGIITQLKTNTKLLPDDKVGADDFVNVSGYEDIVISAKTREMLKGLSLENLIVVGMITTTVLRNRTKDIRTTLKKKSVSVKTAKVTNVVVISGLFELYIYIWHDNHLYIY